MTYLNFNLFANSFDDCVCAHDAPPIKIFNVSEVSLCEDSPSTAGMNPLVNSSRAVAQDVHLVNVTILSFFPDNDKRKSFFDYPYSANLSLIT